MFRVTILFSVFFVLGAEGSVIAPWESDPTTWKLNNLNDSDCLTHLKEYVNALVSLDAQNSFWAFEMLDSTAKVPNGIFQLNFFQIGMFDECVSIQHPEGKFQGKHCMLRIPLTLQDPVKKRVYFEFLKNGPKERQEPRNRQALDVFFQYGVCIPSSCSANHLNAILEKGPFTTDDVYCWTNEEKPLDSLAISFISVCGALAVITAISTCYHYLCDCKKRKPSRLLSAFSLRLHLPKLFEIRAIDGDTMGCLHGIRTMSMFWVILCHTYQQQIYNPILNYKSLMTLINSTKYILVTNGFYSVDTFFFLSGLLVAFVFFRNFNRNGTYDVPMSYVHRFLRLTPPFALMVFAQAALVPEMGYGPTWHDIIKQETTTCKENWWSALLYVQNYVNPGMQCLGQTWYLAVDMQMFWLAPLVMYPVLLWPIFGTVFLAVVTVASSIWTFAIAYSKEYKASLLLIQDQEQFNHEYVATHMRLMPYLAGILCAVVICGIKQRKIQVKIPIPLVILGWIVSAGLCLGILFSIHRFETDDDVPAVESALYLGFSRLGWGLGLAWVVFACLHGYGGIINTILSAGIWQPLGKLSYAAYLIHPTILTYRTATMQTNFFLSDLNVVYEYLATMVLAFMIAILLYSMVEAPFVVLDQEILGSVHVLQYPSPKRVKKAEARVEEGVPASKQNTE